MDCVETAVSGKRSTLLFTLISAVGRAYVNHKTDKFLLRLKIALERPSYIEALREISMFVAVGRDQPEYETQTMIVKNVNGYKQLYAPPQTPYRLSGAQ